MSRKEQMRWTTPDLEKEKADLTLQINELLATTGARSVTDFLFQRIAYFEHSSDQDEQVKRFISIVFLLDWHNRCKCLTSPQIGQLTETGRDILKAFGIHPETSKLSWLYAEIELALAHSRRREGRYFDATWHSGMALYHSRKNGLGDAGFPFLVAGLRAMRHGNFDLAYESFVKVEEFSSKKTNDGYSQLIQARMNRIQILRLRASFDDARYLIDQTQTRFEGDEELLSELSWENICIQAAQTGELIPMLNAIGRSGNHRHPSYMLEATLWAKAVSSKGYLAKTVKADSIKRAFPADVNRSSVYYQLYEYAHQLDLCYDNEIPINLRLTDLGQQVGQANKLLTIDKELLAWAAAARWLGRYHQSLMAVFCAEEYRSLCFRITGGTNGDVFGLSLDFAAYGKKEASYIDKQAIAVPLASISSTRIDRAATISKLTIGLASAKIKSKFRQAFSSAKSVEQIIEEEFRDIGEVFIKAIGAMKGPMVKIAQLISFSTPALPKPLLDALKKTQDSTHPIETDRVIEVIEKSLNRKLDDIFSEFERTPLAAASIGQIHRARLPDGTEVVVKAQYPGILDVIRLDMQLVRMIKFVYHRIFPSANVEEVIAISEQALYEECDYKREADLQIAIGNRYKDHEDIIVPHIYRDLSSKEILVMDYVDGLRFSDFKATASREEKQRAGMIIYTFALNSFFNFGTYNADPHPGNYLFTRDVSQAEGE